MTKDVMISLLRRCNNGSDMLAVLDTLVEDVQSEVMETVTAVSDTIAENMTILDVYGREVVF